MRYNRVLVKLSGGAIAGEKAWGFDPKALNHIADEVLKLHQSGVQVSVVVGGGTGNPYVTTDYPSVQRALELRAEALLAAKNGVDGIYTADPRHDPTARRYRMIEYDTVIQQNLRALDQSAVLLARDHDLPIHVFDFDTPEIMCQICRGEDVGTLISHKGDVLM